jgi:hypothetical protein
LPGKSHYEFILRTLVIENSTPNYSESINIESITTKNISFNNIEVRIPIQRGLDKLNDVKSDLTPTDESVSDEYHIIRWIGDTSKLIHVQYSYSFPWGDILIPIGWIIVGIIVAEVPKIIYKKSKNRV